MNRIKNVLVLSILISFLCLVAIMPVTCLFKTVTGIYCPACGMTRGFISISHFDLLNASYQNLLSIPLFLFIVFSTFMLVKDFLQNSFSYLPALLNWLEHHLIFVIILLIISVVFNNLKGFLFAW